MKQTEESLSTEELLEKLNQMLDPVLSSSRTAIRPAQELSRCSGAQQAFALHWLDVIARTNSELGFQFIANAPAAFRRMDLAQVERWIIRAMDVYDQQGLYPGSQALAGVSDFVSSLGAAKNAIRLDPRRAAVLNYYVNGLSVRPLRIETGAVACTDTETLFLPDLIDQFDSPAKNATLYRLIAAQLWAQTHFGTFKRVDPSAPTLSERLKQYPDPARARELFQRLEHVRLDACLRRTFPGLARQMDSLGVAAPSADWRLRVNALLNPQATVEDTLRLVEQLYSSTDDYPAEFPWAGQIDFSRAEKATEKRITKQQQMLKKALSQFLEIDASDIDSLEDLAITEAAPQENDRDKQSFVMNVNGETIPVPEEVNEILKALSMDLEEILSSGTTGASNDEHYDPSAQSQTDTASAEAPEADSHTAILYDEWDFRRGHYRKEWCHLKEHEMPEGKPGFYAQTLEKYKGSVFSLRRSFELLRNRTQRLKRQNTGDEIDIEALVNARVDAFSGEEMSDEVLSRLERRERDIAVIFMVDVSGSTKGWINDAERECLILLCEALQILGDRYAIYGFSGMTRKRCELYRIKEMGEAYTEAVKARIAGIEPRDYTRMGVTIRHLTRLLNKVSARSRLLITLSDGKPDDYDGYRGEYGIEDTRQALIEAKRSGIHPFCITIDQQAREYLPHMYGAVNYTLIDDVRQLPTKVAGVYRQLTV